MELPLLFAVRCNTLKYALLFTSLLLSLLAVTTSKAAPGSLDPVFGTSGLATTSIDASHDDASAIAVLPSGKILIAGRTIKASMDFALLRYNADGSLDTDFGIGGIVTTEFFGGDDTANAIAVLPDGSIILAGRASGDYLVAKYSDSGVLDTGFANNGYLLVDPSGVGNDTCYGLAITPAGKIVLAGNADFSTHHEMAIVQINANGTIDSDFGGGDGIVTMNPGGSSSNGRAITVQPDGKILVAGDSGTTGSSSTFDFTLLRLNTNGSLDNTFGTAGIATTDVGGFADIGHAIALQVDGSILVAGQAFIVDSAVDFALVRYLPNGLLDASFGTAGRVTTPISLSNDGDNKARTIVIQPDEKIVIAGFSNPVPANPDIDDFALARYTKNGSLDPDFGTAGLVTTPIGGNSLESETGYALAVHPDGRVLLVESNTGGTSTREIWLAGYLAMDSDSNPNTAETWDVTPAAFTFTDVTGATTSSTQTSASMTVAGLGTGIYVPVTITGGDYVILPSSTYSSNIGYVTNGNQISVRHTASASISTHTDTVLTIGGLHAPNNTTLILGTRTSDTFRSTTDDLVPNSFSFTDQTGVATSTEIISNSITVAGVAAATAISVSGGSYSINGSDYTDSSSTVVNGNTVTVRHMSSASASTLTSTTLTIGGVSDTFTSRTADDVTPDAFSFTDQTAVATSTLLESASITVAGITAATAITVTHGEYSVNGGSYTSVAGTVVNGNTVRVRHTSAAAASTAVNTTLSIGGVSDIFTTTTADDVTPNAFSFTDVTHVAHSTQMTSSSFNVAGITAATAISVSGGTYAINGGTYTSVPGTVINGNTVTVRHTSSAADSTAVNTLLTIGGVSDTFTSTTSDLTPAGFSFTDPGNVMHSATMTSNAILVTGITAATQISVSSGTYSINGGAYTGISGTVINTDSVTVRHTSSAADSTTINTTLTIGGVADTFTTTTSDLTPAGFTFTDQTAVTASTLVESESITVTGITAATSIAVINGEYSVNAGSYTSSAGVVVNGNTVKLRHTTSATGSSVVNTELTIGGITDTFSSTTEDDTTPDAFSFATQTSVTQLALIESESITITGISVPVTIMISAGSTYDINNSGATSEPGVVTNGDQIILRHVAASTPGTSYETSVTIGGMSGTFTSTTAAATPPPQSDGGGGAINFLWIMGLAATLIVGRQKKLVG